MPSPEFVDAVLDIVRRIPAGRVMTYGDIAWSLGSNAPRAVGRVMALYGHAVPWWRVVPASGQPPQGHARLALPHYLEEGTPLRGADSLSTGSTSSTGSTGSAGLTGTTADNYRIVLSAARLGYDHDIYSEVAP